MNPSLELGPILRSLRHHKGAFSLLVLEVALGFVMLTHTMIAIRNYYRLYVHPVGLPEDQLVIARRRFLHPRDIEQARGAARVDLAALNGIAPTAALDTAPLPDAAAFPAVLAPRAGGREVLAWPHPILNVGNLINCGVFILKAFVLVFVMMFYWLWRVKRPRTSGPLLPVL